MRWKVSLVIAHLRLRHRSAPVAPQCVQTRPRRAAQQDLDGIALLNLAEEDVQRRRGHGGGRFSQPPHGGGGRGGRARAGTDASSVGGRRLAAIAAAPLRTGVAPEGAQEAPLPTFSHCLSIA